MKTLLAIICTTSLLYSASAEEVFTFDQQPAAPLEMGLPEPVFELPRKKSSLLAVSLSAAIPGLGNAYLGDYKTACGIYGTFTSTIAVASSPEVNDSLRLTNYLTAQNAWSYGIYAAYRDVRVYNGQLGYSYKMPTDSLSDLTSAPFRLSVLKKPEVWGGFLGALAIGLTGSYFAFPKEALIQMNLSSKMTFFPLAALPVGVGEEALFRGFLQSKLSESLTPWGGIVVSSLAFGAVHIPNALALPPEHQWRYYAFSLPLITSMGVYFGWLTHKNHSLKESVAIHTWYDFVIISAGALASRAAITGRYEFAFATEF